MRAAVIWVVLVGVLAALSSSSPSHASSVADAWWWQPLLAGIVGFVVGAGARTSLLLAAVKSGQVGIAGDGRGRFGPLLVAVTAVVVAVAVVAGVDVAVGRLDDGVAVALAGGVGVGLALVWPKPQRLRPTTMSVPAFLGQGALVAAVMAAGLGAVVALGRFGVSGTVAPGAFSQVLAGTLLCDALLGLGGFVRASTSLQRGLIVAPPVVLPEWPGPVLLALLLAAPTVLVLPSVLPVVAATTAVVAKVVVGAVVGGALHLAGGLRGARAVSPGP